MVFEPQPDCRGMAGNDCAFLFFVKELFMKRIKLDQLIFAALCCDCGLIAKKLISPAANIVTEFLHIPGGIATSFSLMFLVIGAAVIQRRGCATLMAVIQSILAFSFGMTGSMGILAPIGYILPGIVIDLCFFISQKKNTARTSGVIPASIASSVCACLVANMIVFRLSGLVLAVYVLVSATSGALCSYLAFTLSERLVPILNHGIHKEETMS